MTDNELIAEWLDWKLGEDTLLRWNDCITCGKPLGERFVVFSPETDIELWHGSDGLLSEIDEKGLDFAKLFGEKVLGLVRHIRVISILMATPAQLTAALVSVIKEE